MYNEIIKRSKSSQIERGVKFDPGHLTEYKAEKWNLTVNLKL